MCFKQYNRRFTEPIVVEHMHIYVQ